MSNRYRLPDRVKERQADELKQRLANYLGPTRERTHRRRWTILLALALAAWLVWLKH